MEKVWKQIDEITKQIYKCYLSMEQLEINGLRNSNEFECCISCLKYMFEKENSLYNKLSILDIEYFITEMQKYDLHVPTTIDTAANYYLQQKLDFDFDKIRFFELRKYNKLLEQYNSRKNFNEKYINIFNKKECVDAKTKKFFIEEKCIRVFDRVGSFEKIKQLAIAQINLNYIELIRQYTDGDYTEIKYNLLFVNPIIHDYYFNNKKIVFNDKVSTELYDYFLNYFSDIYSDDIITELLEYVDEDLKDVQNMIQFFLELLFLKTVSPTLNEDKYNICIKRINKNCHKENYSVIHNMLASMNKTQEKTEKIKK